jgi:hypothetical protein
MEIGVVKVLFYLDVNPCFTHILSDLNEIQYDICTK